MKALFVIASFIVVALSVQAQENPYALLGYKPKEISYEIVQRDYFTIANTTQDSAVKKLMLDTDGGTLYVIGKNGQIVEKIAVGPGDLLRFLSVDPIAGKYPELTPYQFASNTPIQAVDLDGMEAFFVHGTNSSHTRWYNDGKNNTNAAELNPGAQTLFHLTNNKTYDAGFDWGHFDIKWGNFLFNTETDRATAAQELADHVIANMTRDQDITLIGHSHGGNVAIQAVPLIEKALLDRGLTNIKINIITVATPADNAAGSAENPATYGTLINQHTHIYNTIDGVQTGGSNLMDFLNIDPRTIIPKMFSRTYDNPTTSNNEVDVSSKYAHYYSYPQSSIPELISAHSFDVESDFIQKDVDAGKIKKQD